MFDFVLSTGAAATATNMAVSLFKLAWPVAPSWAIVLVAVLSGIGFAFLLALGQDAVFNGPTIATAVFSGVFAAATAAGVSRTDRVADINRSFAQNAQQN